MAIPSCHHLPFTRDPVQAATTVSHHVSMREGGPEPPECFRQESVIRGIVGHRVVSWASEKPPLPLSSQRGQEEWLEGPS